MEMTTFIQQLASGAPVPGGGGASALAAGIGMALCSMVANLTSGKKKYAAYQAEIETVLKRTEASIERFLRLMEKDAEAFRPLAQAYSLPKEHPGRDAILQAALERAYAVPLEIMEEIQSMADVLLVLAQKGTRLAVSDVGVAATVLRAAAQGAALNVYVNTKLMKNRTAAREANQKAQGILQKIIPQCEDIYMQIQESLVAG